MQESNRGFSGIAGRDSARATEIPPRNPPHVKTGMAPGVNARLMDRSSIGIETEINRENSTSGMVATANQANDGESDMTSTSRPISRNKTSV